MPRFGSFHTDDGYRLLASSSTVTSLSSLFSATSPARRRLFFACSFLLLISLASLPYLWAPSSNTPSTNSGYHSPRIVSPKANKLLYQRQDQGRCQFERPTEGLNERERRLVSVLRSKSGTGLGGTEYLGYRDSKDDGESYHPMFDLLREGEEKFERMVEKRSETLEEAVEEYQRRYGRRPPMGFDKWWDYAKEHDVLFPDEYDEIERSLGPFRAFTKEDLAQRVKKAEELPDTVILRVRGGEVGIIYTAGRSSNDYWTHRRTDPQENLIKPVAQFLPDFTLVFGLKDEPQFMFDHELRADLLRLVALNQTLPPSSEITSSSARFPWPRSCPLTSPLRQGLTEASLHSSFISDHRSAQDPCLHPLIASGHGFLLDQKGEWTSPAPKFYRTADEVLGPVMCLSKTARNADVLGVPYDEGDFKERAEDDVEWRKKKSDLYWRGHATGMEKSLNHGISWRLSHRPRLHQTLGSTASLPLVPVLLANPETGKAETRWFAPKTLKEWGYNVRLSGGPMQCDNGDGTCKEMGAVLEFAAEESGNEVFNYKYIFDVDGNAWTSRFQRLMLTNSLVFKSTIFPEWNSDILPPWFAYVPIKMDFTDIPSVLSFFRGSPDSSSNDPGRDDVARRIAANGRCWVERTWRREDLVAYVFRLYLEWARIQGGGEDFVL